MWCDNNFSFNYNYDDNVTNSGSEEGLSLYMQLFIKILNL